MNNKKQKPKKACLPARQGFTLIETMVALFVFSLASVMIAGTFSSFLKNYLAVKKSQRNSESASYAMNLMAKTIRTSAILNTAPITFPLNIYDYSQSKCIQYDYDTTNHKLTVTSPVAPGTPGKPDSCVFSSLSKTDLTSQIIDKVFIDVTPSGAGTKGKVTISLLVQGGSSDFPIQTTVSLRQ